MPRKRAKTSAQKIKIEQRRRAILDYRLQGVPVSAIARAVGVSTSQVIRDIQTALRDVCPRDTREQLLQQELQRLDLMQHAIFASAHDGDLRAIRAVLDIMNHRAKLTGLYPDGKGGEINLNINPSHRDARECGIEIRFVTPRRHPEDDDLPTGEIHELKPPPLKLVEHIPATDDDCNPEPSATAEPRNAVLPEHPGIINDRSKRLPDPVGPRTEFDLPADQRRPNILHETLFRPEKPPKGAA
ncbi:MAG: helix-turn-helix domain-containing protein [Xanthobacteraceae bacterium]